MDFNWTDEQNEFRQRIRSFIEARLPADWERLTSGFDVGSDYTVAFARKFCPELAAEGLLVPHWPKEYGGRDATPWEHWILNEEMIRKGEPRAYQYMSVNWAGPAVMKYGTPEQKEEILTGISTGKIFVCQGFSEPNAGSDLASLKSAARPDGNDWIISGQKIWTSAASFADWCFFLARTGDSDKKAISLFLVPMKSPGIEVRVIKSMMGARALHEVFFDDVRVSGDAILGGVNNGWTAVTSILHNERIGIPRYLLTLSALERGIGRLEREGRFDQLAQNRAARCRAACEAARLQCYKVIDSRVKGSPPSAETSLARAGVVYADRMVGEFIGDYLMDALISGVEPLMSGAYRRATAAGIASGALEIQLDLISRNHLQLPRAA